MNADPIELQKQRIKKLQQEQDVVILAHYYVDGQVQSVADYVGDSYYLSKLATTVKQKTILFCGVTFMGESAKLLNPDKRVVMADEHADCPMAHMADEEDVARIRSEYPQAAVVCYVNSDARLKACSDVCVTSSNAVEVVRALKEDTIYFIPDENLGHYVAHQVPEKKFLFHDGFCHVHKSIHPEELQAAKQARPQAIVLAHPECTQEVLQMADFVGSTAAIIAYAMVSTQSEFIICTEMGILYELERKCPGKRFYSVGHRQFCPNMKKISLDKVEHALQTLQPQVQLPSDIMKQAARPLERMLELAK